MKPRLIAAAPFAPLAVSLGAPAAYDKAVLHGIVAGEVQVAGYNIQGGARSSEAQLRAARPHARRR